MTHRTPWLLVYFILINLVLSQTDYFQQVYDSNNQVWKSLPELSCSSGSTEKTNKYFHQISYSNPVQYYNLTITAKTKSKYQGQFYLSTSCCRSSAAFNYSNYYYNYSSYYYYYNYYNYYADPTPSCTDESISSLYETYSDSLQNKSKLITRNQFSATFCDFYSVDTILYILQVKDDVVDIVDYNDDSIEYKSYIDLLSHSVGQYIIGVTGYGYGSYYIQLECIQYSYPLSYDQYQADPSDLVISSINCENNRFEGKINSSQPIAYYQLHITDDIRLPASLDTANENMVIYIITATKNQDGYDLVAFNDDGDLPLSAADYTEGKYWIILQGQDNIEGDYILNMECPDEISQDLITGLVFGIAGFCLFSLIIYYIYEWVKYQKNKASKPKEEELADQMKKAVQLTKTFSISMETAEEKKEEEMKEPTLLPPNIEITAGGKSIGGVLIRQLDAEKTMMEQLEKDQDVIQMVLAHAISCCEARQKFDIFQVLALRRYAEDSRNIRVFKPFERFTCSCFCGLHNLELIKFSPLARTIIIAIVIAITQTWGISVVVLILIFGAEVDDETQAVNFFQCDMTEYRWTHIWRLKVLSFLMSLAVTFSISQLLDGIRHNGLYEMMDRLELQHIKRVNHMALWILQIGQAINYFVCLVAILGSYFIIFNSNQGELHDDGTTDYSKAAREMILNAIALFFMLELDDLMVSDYDYNDCQKHLKWILLNYKPNLEINMLYRTREKSKIVEEMTERKFTEEMAKYLSSSWTMDKCNNCIVTTMYYFINIIALIVTVICYGGGFIAPFFIFFCW